MATMEYTIGDQGGMGSLIDDRTNKGVKGKRSNSLPNLNDFSKGFKQKRIIGWVETRPIMELSDDEGRDSGDQQSVSTEAGSGKNSPSTDSSSIIRCGEGGGDDEEEDGKSSKISHHPLNLEAKSQLEALLNSLGMKKYIHLFVKEDVTVSDLSLMSESDLTTLGIPLGPRLRLVHHFSTNTSQHKPDSAHSSPPVLPAPSSSTYFEEESSNLSSEPRRDSTDSLPPGSPLLLSRDNSFRPRSPLFSPHSENKVPSKKQLLSHVVSKLNSSPSTNPIPGGSSSFKSNLSSSLQHLPSYQYSNLAKSTSNPPLLSSNASFYSNPKTTNTTASSLSSSSLVKVNMASNNSPCATWPATPFTWPQIKQYQDGEEDEGAHIVQPERASEEALDAVMIQLISEEHKAMFKNRDYWQIKDYLAHRRLCIKKSDCTNFKYKFNSYTCSVSSGDANEVKCSIGTRKTYRVVKEGESNGTV